MKIKPKEVTRRVKLMRNPQPVAMAVVDQGACQTPFAVVKRDKISLTNDEGTDNMAKTLRIKAGKGAARQSAVTKMQFSKTSFPDEAAVKGYLDDMGIDGVGEVEDGNDVWIVPSTEDFTGQIVGKARATPGKDAGVTVFIAELSNEVKDDASKRASNVKVVTVEEEDDGAGDTTAKGMKKPEDTAKEGEDGEGEEEPAKKHVTTDFPVLATKYDYWGAYCSGEQSLKDVISDGCDYDGLVPGVSEVLDAYASVVGNILIDDDIDTPTKATLVAQAGADSSQIIMDLYAVFEMVGENAMKSAKKSVRGPALKFTGDFADALETLANGNVITTTKATGDEDGEADEGEEGEGEADTGEPQTEAEPAAKGTDPVLKEVSKQLGTVTEMLTGLAGRMDAVEAAQKETTSTLARSTTRKSLADAAEDLTADNGSEAEAENARKTVFIQDATRALGGRVRSN